MKYKNFIIIILVLITNNIITNNYNYSTSKQEINSLKGIQRPIIEDICWGKINCKFFNKVEAFKDVIITPKKLISWDWIKTGTKHSPGIEVSVIKDFINDADIFILSKGMDEVLQTTSDTIEFLKVNKKQFYILQSIEAVKLYNKLVKNNQVVALIHTTC